MADSNFASQMLAIGAASTFDATKLSNSTLRSTASHIKTLKRNNVALTEDSLTLNTVYMLDRLVDIHGKLLTDAYKRQIGLTIKRMYPQHDISLEPYNKTRQRKSKTRMASEKFVTEIRMIRDETVNILNAVEKQRIIHDLGLYDTCLSILLTISTSLRINEILQLKLMHIPKIIANDPIGIKSKSSNNIRFIAPNDLLVNVFTTLQRQRSLVKQNIMQKKLDHASKFQMNRLESGYLIMSSEDYMRKKLHELSASLGIKSDILGFNVFRKHITSVLTSGGGHFIAQALNNHSSVNTTLDHYNVVTSQSAQMAYDDLIGKFDLLDPPDNAEQPDILMTGDNKFVIKTDVNNPNIKVEKVDNKIKTNLKNETLPQKVTRTIQNQNLDINHINELYEPRFNYIDALYNKTVENLKIILNTLEAGQFDANSTNKQLQDALADVNNLNAEIKNLNNALQIQLQSAQENNQVIKLTAIINYKKKLDAFIKKNSFMRKKYIDQIREAKNSNESEMRKELEAKKLNELEQQQRQLQFRSEQLQQLNRGNRFDIQPNIYDTPPHSNTDVMLKNLFND